MTLQELLQRFKKDAEQGSGISHDTLIHLKKFLEDAKNSQNQQNLKQQDLFSFKEKMIGQIIHTLIKSQPIAKDKILMLEILQRDLISTKHNVNLFNKLYHFLLEQDQTVAIQASKTIDALIKQINEGQQSTPGATTLDLKNHYIKLFEFLKEKTEFLLRLQEHTKSEEFKVYRRQSYEQREKDKDHKEKDKDKKQIVFRNSKSLKFINQVPHLFIHLMAYVDTNNRGSEEDQKIKQLIRQSIRNIIQALKKTPYQDFYNEFNYDFNNELFGVMTKLLQFLFINLRNDKDSSSSSGNKSNQNLKKNIADQAEFINVTEVIKNFIYLLRNCSEDFQLNRYQIVNRLRLLLTNLERTKLSKSDAISIMNEILNEETIFGKKKILGDYSKNAICSYWVEIIKSPVLVHNVFPANLLSIRAVCQNSAINEDSKEIVDCFNNIQKLVQQVLKTIFDNSIYPSVQQKCIQLIIFFIEQLFPEGFDQGQVLSYLSSSTGARRIHECKLKVLLKIQHAIEMKFQSIRQTFEEIDTYVTKKLGHKITKADLPEPLKLNHMHLNLLKNSQNQEMEDENSQSVKQKRTKQFSNFIEGYDNDIDSSLLTLTAIQNRFLTIYEQDDELCFNSHPVKITNYTLYMKEVKTKLLEKCITLSHKITRTFLVQNLESYSPLQLAGLKQIYYVVQAKRNLTADQCKILSLILKNGLKIFELLHNYDLHSDDQTNKKGHLKNFMLIFAQIYDPVNFRDIFEPNMNEFFKNLIIYAKTCSEYCLQHVLIEPYCSNQQNQTFNKNIVQLLTYNLILRLESTTDQLDPFHEFYDYKQEYFLLLQKLIRFPFRCLSRYSDDSFIRNYFRQIILFLTKKAHNSRFCLDYLHLMRTLFKNILFNSNRQSASPLFQEFYAICCKNSINSQIPPNSNNSNSVFLNVNILQNFLKFFNTGIPELADIVTELIIMLPLKSKHIIQFAKQGYIVKPLLHCLCLMSDYNYLLRTLKTFQIIISHSSAQEINSFLQGVKEKLINRLFEMVINEYKSNDLKPEKINNDLSSLSLKLLAKLGCLSRNRDLAIEMKNREQIQQKTLQKDFLMIYQGYEQNGKQFSVSLMPSIEYALEIFHKLLDSYYQSVVYISMQMIQKCFYLLLDTLPIVLQKMSPLSVRIVSSFCLLLALSSKYLTISQSILNKIRNEVKDTLKKIIQQIKISIKQNGLTEYSKFIIKCLVENLNERVLITREDNFIKQISQQPKKFLWEQLLLPLFQASKQAPQKIHFQVTTYIVNLLISQIIMIKNPTNQVYYNHYQKDYNYILPYKNAALSAMNQLIDKLPQEVFDEVYSNILQSVYIALGTLPDILNLKISKHPQSIARKVFKFMLRDENQYVKKYYSTEQGYKAFMCILENLVGYSLQGHKISMIFLDMIMDESNDAIKLHQLLFNNIPWDELADTTSAQYTKTQAKYVLSQFNTKEKELKKYPITLLVKSLLRITHNITEQNINNEKSIKLLTNCFSTFEFLISIRHNGKKYQAFEILTRIKESQEFEDKNVIFTDTFKKIINIGQQIIAINGRLFEGFAKIILETNNNGQPQMGQPNQPPNQPGQSRVPSGTGVPPQPNRARDPNAPNASNAPNQPPASGQTFNINTNTFIDDEQYGLNIEDLDIQVKNWGGLISSVLKFLKSTLTSQTVSTISKQLLKKKEEKNKVISIRLDIIVSMFDLIGRVDRNVRDTAYECLKDLLSREQHPKQLINNDDQLKRILRPTLISLQLQFKKFTPSFLIMFKKILKLLTQCFNITLIQKLVDKLRQMQRQKLTENTTQSRSMVPPPPQIRHMNYSQITNEVKCISSFLGLFQHLAYAYHNHRSQNYTVNSIIIIFKYITSISSFFTPKLGKHSINMYIKKTLSKVFNTMCQKLSGQSIFDPSHDINLQHFLELIQLDQSFPLREKLTRQTQYMEKTLTDLSKTKKKEYYIFLDILYTLASRSNRWMKGFHILAEKIEKQLLDKIQFKCSKFQDRRKSESEYNQRNQIILLTKILLEYCKRNPTDIKALFTLVCVFKVRSTFDLHFLRRYLKYDLYYNTSAETKRKIMMEYFAILKQPHKRQSNPNISFLNDAQKILAVSQHIIYYIILIETNLEKPEERVLMVNDQNMIKAVEETIKICLNTRNLYIKGNANNSNIRSISYNYRIAIEVLQITNLMLNAYKDVINESHRNNMLLTVWGLLRIQDKIIKNYAFVWTSNYIRVFDNFDNQRALGLYLTLIRALEGLSQGDFQLGALIKKSLNILIPYWDNRSQSQHNSNWIQWSLKAVHEQSNQPNRLVRFWQIVVKNHKIFRKFKESKFQTQMVNSMQWLMVANNPTSTNPLIKKIASDMSFIYIEWKFQQAKQRILDKEALEQKDDKQVGGDQNKQVQALSSSSSNTDRAAEICLNFFIKVALNNSSDKDDKQIMKRSLYLLKKTLILWPHTKKKFESIKIIVNKLKSAQQQTSSSSSSSSANSDMPLRFHYTLLNIINILMSYESDSKLLPQIRQIFQLLEMGGHPLPVNSSRGVMPNHPSQQHVMGQGNNTIFTMNNIYLLNLLCKIIRRLVKIAIKNEEDPQGGKLMSDLHQYIRDGFEYHVVTGNRSRTMPQAQRNMPMKKIEVQVAICFLKILYDIDTKLVDTHLNYIKQVTSSLKKMFEKGFETSSKNNNPSRVFELPPLVQESFSEMLEKDLEINIDLIKPELQQQFQQNYQKQNIKSYSTRRPLFVILIRILAAKFNSFTHIQDKSNALDIFISIYEKIPDPQLKIEVINILKCMFIGQQAFKEGKAPERYSKIEKILYPTNKIFFLLFQDNNKFNEHFERKKSKPSDQNYNINERIYEEITTKVYFNFLCTFIIHLDKIGELKPLFLEKVKIFVLYAVKVVQGPLIDQIFNILSKSYHNQSLQLYSCLFQDYKELNCAEEYLQGDEIMAFFTIYLYKRATKGFKITSKFYNTQMMVDFHQHFLTFLKVDLPSEHHIKNISKAFGLSLQLLPQSRNLPKILKDYLLTGSYNQAWGSVLLKIILKNYKTSISPQEMYSISTKINEWGLLVKYLQEHSQSKYATNAGQKESCNVILDFVYRAYGDKDLINGYRMSISMNEDIQKALSLLQQRKYAETLKIITNLQNEKLKRMIICEDDAQSTGENLSELEELLQDNYINDMSKECYKNLDKWDQILQQRNEPLDMEGKIDYLFHSKGNKEKIQSILRNLEEVNNRQFPYFYGKSILNFLESNTSQNKELNISLLYSLLEWLSFPKNAIMNQNRMLVKIQCLLELEQGEKIKQQSLTSNPDHPVLVDALTKVVQSVYTHINSWRERMPNKYQDMSIWNAILGQRIMIYNFMKNKMLHLLDSVLKSSNHTNYNMTNATEKLLIPYTDIQWNKLRLCKQQRGFGIYHPQISTATNTTTNTSGGQTSTVNSLYLDEIYLKEKEKFFFTFQHEKDHPKAIQLIQNAVKQISKDQSNHRDDQLIKLQKLELNRLKAMVLVKDGHYEQANEIYLQNVNKISNASNGVNAGNNQQNQQHLLTLWRDWMVMCIKAYQKTKKLTWAQSAIAVFPYALRYKQKKTRLLLSSIFEIIQDQGNEDSIVNALNTVLESIPCKFLILWLPQLIKIAEDKLKISPVINKILTKLAILFPQLSFFTFKPLFKGYELKQIKETYVNMKKDSYNLITKLENFSTTFIELKHTHDQKMIKQGEQSNNKISVSILGNLTRCLSQIHIPLYETYKSDLLDQSMIPMIAHIDQSIHSQEFNGVQGKLLKFLGNNGKEYEYRLEKNVSNTQNKDKNPNPALNSQQYEIMLGSQCMEIIHSHLEYWKESTIRKLKFLEIKKLYLQFDISMVKSSRSYTSFHEILNQYMMKNTPQKFTADYPLNNSQFMSKIPQKQKNSQINKHMKKLVSVNAMKQYFVQKAMNLDEYNSFKKIFAYQYGVVCAVHFIFGVEIDLQKLIIDMKTGFIYMNNFKFNIENSKPNPYAVRLSRNIKEFLGKTLINGAMLPAFMATIDALNNKKLNFSKYVQIVFKDLTKMKEAETGITIPDEIKNGSFVLQRLNDLHENIVKVRKILELAEKVADSKDVPINLKYWF